MKVKKIKKSIFTDLVVCFFLYPLLIVVTLTICLTLAAVTIGDGDVSNLENILPESALDSDGNIKNMEYVEKLGGWVEELDIDYNVINVYGEKKTEINKYTQNEIYNLISKNGNGEYIGFICPDENSEKCYLYIYSRDLVRIDVTIILNGDKNAAVYNVGTYVSTIFYVAVIVYMIVFSLYLRKKIKKPLDIIISGMDGLKMGKSSTRIDLKTESEFQQIVDSFNVMAEQLEAEKEEKNELIRKKNQLLLELSHDIKTPIATIKSYANALEAGLVPEDKLNNYYHTIDIKADRVRELSDNMFMMLKMDNSDYNIQRDKVNMCEYLRQICAEYYDEITESGFDFQIDIPNNEIVVEADLNLFSRVIGNLLLNAQKYNKTGKIISVSCRESKENVCIKVIDNGESIEQSLAQQMFTPFVRGDKTRKSDGGTGLGLAISKIIVEKHGGTIEYYREGTRNVFEILL